MACMIWSPGCCCCRHSSQTSVELYLESSGRPAYRIWVCLNFPWTFAFGSSGRHTYHIITTPCCVTSYAPKRLLALPPTRKLAQTTNPSTPEFSLPPPPVGVLPPSLGKRWSFICPSSASSSPSETSCDPPPLWASCWSCASRTSASPTRRTGSSSPSAPTAAARYVSTPLLRAMVLTAVLFCSVLLFPVCFFCLCDVNCVRRRRLGTK